MLRNLNLGPRLALAFGVLAIIVLLQGVFSLNKMQAVEAGGHEIMENWLPSIEALDNFKVALMRYRIFAVRMLLDVEPQNMSRNQAKRATLKNEIDKTQADYEKLISEDQEHKVFDELVKTKDQYFANVERIEALIKAGDIEKAGVVLDNDQLTLAENMVRQLQILSEINKSGSEKTIKSAAETFDSSRITVTVSIVVSLIITIIMAYSITSSITVPINKAVLATEVIARGDLSHRIEVIGRDEPALLLAGVAQMQANLRNTIQEIAHSSIQLAAATEELSAVATDNTRNMQRQSDEIQQAATAVTEMSSAVDEVARNAISASEASNQSSELAKDGLERVRQTVSSIENMTVEVTKTSSLMEGLAEQSQGIGKVLDVIRAIAEQTNLLALNAAIEAARAGEAGRGFAVVADEVRALAHRTQVSTQEIESMISKVQSGTYAAVTSMRDSSEHAKGTLGIAQQAGKALDEIFARSNTISDRNLMIATATEEQAAVAREVDRNIVNISDLSAQSAAGANQTSSSAHELARLATSLNNLVTKFVV